MHGARRFARDFIAPLMVPGTRVLDVACGDRWVKEEFKPEVYEGLDIKWGQDLTSDSGWWRCHLDPTLILSVYGICTLLGEEARVWTLLRRIAKPTTKFVYVGRYFRISHREMGRQDPINGYNRASIEGLSMASGWKVVEFKTAAYDGEEYSLERALENNEVRTSGSEPNAFAATMEPI